MKGAVGLFLSSSVIGVRDCYATTTPLLLSLRRKGAVTEQDQGSSLPSLNDKKFVLFSRGRGREAARLTKAMSDAEMGAMDAREYKVNIPEKQADAGGRVDSPEQYVSTPSYETQSGFKRLRTNGWEDVEGSEQCGGVGAADAAPGTSMVVATQDEVRHLQERTKLACSQLAEVILQLRRGEEEEDDVELERCVVHGLNGLRLFSNRGTSETFSPRRSGARRPATAPPCEKRPENSALAC